MSLGYVYQTLKGTLVFSEFENLLEKKLDNIEIVT